MDIKTDWTKIRNHFNKSFKSNFHVSIASVDSENKPTVTPIGTLFLNGNQTGFYFEKYPSKLPQSATANKNICILGVNSSTWFWLKSLYLVKFDSYPAVKLYGQLGIRRQATEIEIDRLNRRMKPTKWTKGNKYLWGDMTTIREITFTNGEAVNIGKMTNNLK
ncbi:MAG: pyridoxamine 5'-phosphate oxidase family protein [Saprospiraceae bacterium]